VSPLSPILEAPRPTAPAALERPARRRRAAARPAASEEPLDVLRRVLGLPVSWIGFLSGLAVSLVPDGVAHMGLPSWVVGSALFALAISLGVLGQRPPRQTRTDAAAGDPDLARAAARSHREAADDNVIRGRTFFFQLDEVLIASRAPTAEAYALVIVGFRKPPMGALRDAYEQRLEWMIDEELGEDHVIGRLGACRYAIGLSTSSRRAAQAACAGLRDRLGEMTDSEALPYLGIAVSEPGESARSLYERALAAREDVSLGPWRKLAHWALGR